MAADRSAPSPNRRRRRDKLIPFRFDLRKRSVTAGAVATTLSPRRGATLRLIRESAVRGESRRLRGKRAERACRWAEELDVTIRSRRVRGEAVEVRIPHANPWRGRAYARSVEEYRRLRLGVGHLIRPWILGHEELEPPPLGPLYPFQRDGVEWILSRPGGAILADDMGLGKTVQVITAIRILVNRALMRRVLVLCPKSLLANWDAEFARWAPELGVATVTPSAGIKEAAWRALAWRRHALLTNYEQMRDPPEALRSHPPDLIVADEAHRLRKRTAKLTAGVMALRPGRFWAVTGTPLERDADDLATILSVIERRRFSASDARLHPSSLRAQARPYVLRRRKSEVLKELPPVRDAVEHISLSPEQKRAYQRTIADVRSASDGGNELALLTRLREVCDFDRTTGRSSKADRILELLPRIREAGEKAVVFSYLLGPLRDLHSRVTRDIGPHASRLLVGAMTGEERDQVVREFREEKEVLVLLASTRVAGEGLTLVEANHAFLFNQWWNPSTNHQATDRIVRIGQKKSVRIYRFCCRETIEERLETILETKSRLFESAVERLADDPTDILKRIQRTLGTDALLGHEKGTP